VSTELLPRDSRVHVLRSGATIPTIGMGTFGSDKYDAETVSGAVLGAIRTGYRLIDCASVYGNEADIGSVLAQVQSEGVERESMFVVSKIWNDSHEPAAALRSVEKSLADLQVGYLDAVFVHWPFPNHHAPFADAADRDPHARPYDHARYMDLWRTLESLVDSGVVRHLGTSNVTIPKLELILRDARIAPALNEMELHPCFQQPELFRYCLDNGIRPVGYSPLGSPSRPERDRTDDDVVDTEHPVVRSIAGARGVHPAEICIKWAIARGQIPIPFAVKPGQLESNLRAALSDPLVPSEIEALRSVDRNSRLIKGQVFLWEGARSWLELWDVDGTIPGPDGYEADRAPSNEGTA